MAGVHLAGLLLLCVVIPWTQCHPHWFYPNSQVFVIQCSHEYLFQYGKLCIKFPVQWNTTNASSPTPAPAPAPPPEEPLPPEEPPATEEPAITTLSPGKEALETAVRREVNPRRARGINVGPSFSVSLPSLQPPLSLYLTPPGQPTYAQPPATVIVQVPGRAP